MNPDKLEMFNCNIVKWYEFNPNSKVLQIGKNSNVTEELKKRNLIVETIENINKLKEGMKYEYVILYGYENYQDVLQKVQFLLQDDGKLFIIGENKLGINNWSKYDITDSTGISYLEHNEKKIKTIKSIKNELEKIGFNKCNIFYVFPNYKNAELLINKNSKMKSNLINRYSPDILASNIKIFDETKMLKTLIDNDEEILEFFANSYFIEVSKKDFENTVQYVSFNNYRKDEYQLITIMKDEFVEKKPANELAVSHIENMSKIIEEIKTQNIEILDFVKDNKLYSKLVKDNKTLDLVLAENYSDINKLAEILNVFKENVLLKMAVSYEECKEYVDTNIEFNKCFKFLKNGYWDLIPKNCFYINDTFMFFDQEWTKEYLPVEFILYRAIINSYDLVTKINVDDLFKKLNILEYKEYFQKLDDSLRDKILDKEIYNIMYNKENLKSLDCLTNDNKVFWKENQIKDNYIKEIENRLQDLKKENDNKQEYILNLETDNNMKKKYIQDLKKDNNKKQEYISILEKRVEELNKGILKRFFKKGDNK